MGGCASRPKETDGQDNLPVEKPTSPDMTSKSVEAEAVTDKIEAVGNENDKKEDPLLDLSEPKPEVPIEESNAAIADAVTGSEQLNQDSPQNTSTESGDAKQEVTKPEEKAVSEENTEIDKIAPQAGNENEEAKKVDVEAEDKLN